MLRSTTAALLAAYAAARGNSDGTSSTDAWTTTLVDEQGVQMQVHFWNQQRTDLAWELHGDWELSFSNQFGGIQAAFAIKIPDQTNYDIFAITARDLTSSSASHQIYDRFVETKTIGIGSQDASLENADYVVSEEWVQKGDLSVNCTAGPDPGADRISCAFLGLSFKRDFVTDSSTEDVQLDESMIDRDFNIYGLVTFINIATPGADPPFTIPTEVPSNRNTPSTKLVSSIVRSATEDTTGNDGEDTSGGDTETGNTGEGTSTENTNTNNNSGSTSESSNTETTGDGNTDGGSDGGVTDSSTDSSTEGTDGTNTDGTDGTDTTNTDGTDVTDSTDTAANETATNSTDSGSVEETGEQQNEDSGATSVTTFGAAVLAAVTALVY